MAQEDLINKYTELYGKKPHHMWSDEKLQEKIDSFDPDAEVEQDEPKSKEVKTEEVKDPVMDFKIDREKSYEFELQRRKSARHNIPTTARSWCEATKSIRDIRYCRTEDSPYVDEQSETAKVERESIRFTSKTLTVSGSEEAKIRYLLAYDANGDKSKVLPENVPAKNLYKLKDQSAEDNAQVDHFKQVVEAGNIITKASEAELTNFMRSRFGEKSDRFEEILKKAYQKAQSQPALFVSDFTNPKHAIKANLQEAVEKQYLIVDGNQVKFAKTNAVAKTFEKDRYTFDEALARWILSGDKEGKEFYSLIQDKLK